MHCTPFTTNLAIRDLPRRARTVEVASLAAVLGGQGWWQRVWRRLACRVERLDIAGGSAGHGSRQIGRGSISGHRAAGRPTVFRSFWRAFRF